MQTSTHLRLGIVFSPWWLFFHEITKPFSFLTFSVVLVGSILGSVLPDLVMVPQYLYDKYIRRIQPMTQQCLITIYAKEISHSLVIWFSMMYIYAEHESNGEYLMYVLSWSALIAGVIPDIFTHVAEEFEETDTSYLWPLGWLLGYGTIRSAVIYLGLGREYRKAHGDLSKKPWEELVSSFLNMFFVVSSLMLFLVVMIL
jgi:hypothetical protein